MISLEERQKIVAMVEQARDEGARLKAACEVGGIDARTLRRWETNAGLRHGDARPHAIRPVLPHALNCRNVNRSYGLPTNRALRLCRPRALCPRWRTKGVYIASGSSCASSAAL